MVVSWTGIAARPAALAEYAAPTGTEQMGINNRVDMKCFTRSPVWGREFDRRIDWRFRLLCARCGEPEMSAHLGDNLTIGHFVVRLYRCDPRAELHSQEPFMKLFLRFAGSEDE